MANIICKMLRKECSYIPENFHSTLPQLEVAISPLKIFINKLYLKMLGLDT